MKPFLQKKIQKEHNLEEIKLNFNGKNEVLLCKVKNGRKQLTEYIVMIFVILLLLSNNLVFKRRNKSFMATI